MRGDGLRVAQALVLLRRLAQDGQAVLAHVVDDGGADRHLREVPVELAALADPRAEQALLLVEEDRHGPMRLQVALDGGDDGAEEFRVALRRPGDLRQFQQGQEPRLRVRRRRRASAARPPRGVGRALHGRLAAHGQLRRAVRVGDLQRIELALDEVQHRVAQADFVARGERRVLHARAVDEDAVLALQVAHRPRFRLPLAAPDDLRMRAADRLRRDLHRVVRVAPDLRGVLHQLVRRPAPRSFAHDQLGHGFTGSSHARPPSSRSRQFSSPPRAAVRPGPRACQARDATASSLHPLTCARSARTA